MGKAVGEENVPPLIIADSAFPLRTWLMKPYTNSLLSPQQRYFNCRLSRGRMVTEGAYGQLKGRWRVLLRKNESDKEHVRTANSRSLTSFSIFSRKQASQRATLRPAFQPGVFRASYTKKIPACQTCILCWREARTIHTILDSRHIAFLHPRSSPPVFFAHVM